ncbi:MULTISPECIES: efflux RND transporter periplasmic adaptor subunit [Niastella]|uniref:Efflux RND transporter periplasmic adaptor subunit n=1 Tax=Niastella soli TaxID=2821487 RepID=A0ABS3Z3H5_9BACT|nr:efflux RND transporter periplasmic adaptor subunit [Niastella soli]MBO9204720.1 efflux RND transporter periplasmic adaptor subunit [Niastella soli]
MITYKSTITAAFVIASAVVISCNHPKAATPDDNGSLDSIIRNATTAPVTIENETDFIKLNGKIQANEDHQAKVYALASGKIKSVNVALGDKVQKGQTLAVLQSMEVAGNSNDLTLAESNVALTKKNLESTKDLYEGSLATERDYMSAKVDYNKALSELNRAKEVQAITGGKNATYELKAPLTGYVIERNITNNSEVRQDNSNPLFTVADLNSVWVIANVYESDISHIHLGDTVTVTTLANPATAYTGKIDKIYNVLDPATRTMKVRISMPNPNADFMPEMFVTVKVNGKATAGMLSIPSQAIVLDDSKNFVIVKDPTGLHIKEIQLIKRVDSKAYIQGLKVGDQVVTNSQVFIYQALSE